MDETKNTIEALQAHITELENRVGYLFDDFLTVAGRALEAERKNKDLLKKLSEVAANTPISPQECYVCGSCDVVSAWFITVNRRMAGFSTQPGTVLVWICAKHEPQLAD